MQFALDENEFTFRLPVNYFECSLHEGDVFDISLRPMPEKKQSKTDEIVSLLDRLKKKGEK